MNNQYYNPYMASMRNATFIPNGTRMASPLTNTPLIRNSPLSFLGTRSASPLSAISSAATKSSFSFTGLLNGASKTLGVINQAIPVFYQIKPIFNNAKTMYRVAKEINKGNSTNQTENNNTKNTIKKEEQVKSTITNDKNEPTFFM